jgi:Glyoxalase-like domain
MPKANMEVVIDCAEPLQLRGFWREALDYREHWAVDDLVVLVPETGVGTPVLLQRVPEPKTTKNRVHIDLVHDDVHAEASRLESLGARRSHPGVRTYGPTEWVTMTDPEGNEFCVSTGVPAWDGSA